MTPFARAFTPTNNRRLNELVGFLLLVSALLLFLAIASYSPLDRSFNTASTPLPSHPSRNWIGIAGAYGSDLLLQFAGLAAFVLPVYLGMLGARWFRSRKVESPVARVLGACSLVVFASALLALLPWHGRWNLDPLRRGCELPLILSAFGRFGVFGGKAWPGSSACSARRMILFLPSFAPMRSAGQHFWPCFSGMCLPPLPMGNKPLCSPRLPGRKAKLF